MRARRAEVVGGWQPRWGQLYAIASLGLGLLWAVTLTTEAGALRTALECGGVLVLFAGMAGWVHANRGALDRGQAPVPSSRTIRVRVIVARLAPPAPASWPAAGPRGAGAAPWRGVTLGGVSRPQAPSSRRDRVTAALWRPGYLQAATAVLGATAVSWSLFRLLDLADLVMVYLLAIVVVASRYGRGPSVFAAVASVAAFDVFFVPPYLTFVVADNRHVLTFAVMLVVGLVISGLTARVRRHAEVAQDARVRAETERLRNALLTSVSHDLRTPLAAITGAATTMLEDGSRLDPRAQRELLESVREEADRLNRLVQNLLEMTRLESGVLALHRDWHPLEEIVGAALGRLTRSLGARKIAVTLPSDLPLVAIDDVLIEQVLVNLLDNAVKYTPGDSPICIAATAADGVVTVEVADRGPGLPPGHEDQVFEKFYRGASNGRGGAGLGLAICRGIVQAHGGRIWAESLGEGGAVFRFTLPSTETPPAPVAADA